MFMFIKHSISQKTSTSAVQTLNQNIMTKNTYEEINTPCHDKHSILQGMAYGMLAGVEPVVGIYTGSAN